MTDTHKALLSIADITARAQSMKLGLCAYPVDEIVSLLNAVKSYEAALTPRSDTKAEYIGEFQFTVTMMELDESDEPYECQRMVQVPWTTIKEIMAAIRSKAE